MTEMASSTAVIRFEYKSHAAEIIDDFKDFLDTVSPEDFEA